MPQKNKPARDPEAMQSPVETPKKKKKKKKRKEEEEEDAWTEEATNELLHKVTQQLPPSGRDTLSCRVMLKRVKWESAAVPGHSPSSCRDRFMALYRRISPFKSLTTVVEEMVRLAGSGPADRRNRPILPLHRFLKDYFTEERKEEARRRGESIFKLGHQAWKNLPAEEKDQYTQSYRDDWSKLRSSSSSVKTEAGPIKVPKLPYQLCWEVERHTTTTTTTNTTTNSRSYFASLPPERQVPYIRQALEDLAGYEAALHRHLALHPDFKRPSYQPIPKRDVRAYLDAKGCPAMPPTRPALVFYREMQQKASLEEEDEEAGAAGGGNEAGVTKLAEAMLKYKELSRVEKAHYKEKLEEGLRQYEEQLSQWSAQQERITLFALKKYRDSIPYIKLLGQKTPKHMKTDSLFPHKAPAVTSCPKFLLEPTRPPPTAYRLFTTKMRAEAEETTMTGPELQRLFRDAWRTLGDEEKAQYIARCRRNQCQYEKEVKAYVRQLDGRTRKLYLGFNRIPLFRFFGNRDVFAEEYPNDEQYPVLVKGLDVVTPTKQEDDHHRQQEEEEEEDKEEEEEEDLLSFKSPPSKRKLSSTLFTSLLVPPSDTQSASPKKKKKKKKKEEEEEDTPARPPPPLPLPLSSDNEEEERPPAVVQTKKSIKKVTAAAAAKKVSPAPLLKEEEEEESSEEEEEEVVPAWRSAPPTPHTPKGKQQQQQQQKQQQRQQYSSSDFSDSDFS